MKKIFKLKKEEYVFDKKRNEEIINYINKCLLKKGDNIWKPRFRKDIRLTIQVE